MSCLQDEYWDAPGSVVASDFYHSNTLMAMSDDEIVQRVHSNIAACEPGFADAKVDQCMLSSRWNRQKSWTPLKKMHAETGRDPSEFQLVGLCGRTRAIWTAFRSLLCSSIHLHRAQVVDAAVLKFKGAVTHFSPGSYASRPLQRTSFPNLFMAGAPPAAASCCL